MMTNFIVDYFEAKVFKEDYGDKEIVFEEFKNYFEEEFTFTNKLRLFCYNNYRTVKDINSLDPNKPEGSLLTAISKLKLEFSVSKKDNLNSYKTNAKGLSNLYLAVSKFISNSKYIQTQLGDTEKKPVYNTKDLIKIFYNFFSTYYEREIKFCVNTDSSFLDVDYMELCQYDYKLMDYVEQTPLEAISLMEETIKNFQEEKILKIRLFNLPEGLTIKIGHHRAKDLDKLVQFEGIIKRKTDVNPKLKYLEYLCSNPDCNLSENKLKVPQVDEKARTLKACPRCKSGVELVNKVLIDSMFILLEEDYSNSSEDAKLKTINLNIEGDLVLPTLENKYKPGQKVKVIGVLREKPILTKGGVESTNYHTILDVNNIIADENSINLDISKEDLDKIKEFGKNPNNFKILLNNFIPEIQGYKNIKASMLLQLGGSDIGNKNQRADSHLLLVGDPGVAKTKLATYYLEYAPKAVYSSGTNTSKAGLTGACIKDEFTGDWAIEAGVLPKANGGIAVIDELDKMSSEDSQAMHDALETQIVPIRKAISVDLVCKCGVLAIANPKYSSFDDTTDVIKQIDLPGSLLNRFDLIYILKDKYDKKKDIEISEHIIKSWNDEEVNFNLPEETLDKQFIRKYIYFCKNNIFPKISEEAKELLISTNDKLRARTQNELFKFNPRQFNGIIRLAIAHAKLTFKHEVDKKSVEFAVFLYTDFLEKFGFENLNSIVASTYDITHKKLIEYILMINEVSREEIYTKFNHIKPEELDKEINRAKKEGLIFEPRKDILKPLQ